MALLLDKQGMALALIMGIALFLSGGWQYLVLMLVFLALSVAATKHQHFKKREMGIYEHERGWENVLSNGLVPTVLAILKPQLGLMPFVAAIAAITADKFASELGVLSGNPISLENFQPAKPGTSGAVSPLGLLLSLAGGTIIGVCSIIIFNITPSAGIMIGIAGLFGSVIDSIAGVFEERGIGTKGTTNMLCALAGAACGFFIR